MKKLTIIISVLLLTLLSSCDNKEVCIYYSDCNSVNNLIYHKGKTFTGKVWSQDAGSYLETQDGHQIALIGLYNNGNIAYKMEFYSPDKRYHSFFSKDGKLLFRQEISKGWKYRPQIWDFEGNELDFDDFDSPSVQRIIEYKHQYINPIAEHTHSAYNNQLNKASY